MRPTSTDRAVSGGERSRKSSVTATESSSHITMTEEPDELSDTTSHNHHHKQQQNQNRYVLADASTIAAAAAAFSSPMHHSNKKSDASSKSRSRRISLTEENRPSKELDLDLETSDNDQDGSVFDDDEVERSSIASFPYSITDTLPPPSPARPSHLYNTSPSPYSTRTSIPSTTELAKALEEIGSGVEVPPTQRKKKLRSDVLGPGGESPPISIENSTMLAPQLIMPTIRMPTRRPFTDRGKNVGRLKILVAGDSGIGKSSLIKSIMQKNNDIVHVDPLSTPASSITSSGMSASQSFYSISGRSDSEPTKKVTEVYASTRPYPPWWSDFEDSRILRRRKSGGEVVLERNICFVDTPGYGAGASSGDCIELVLRYIEKQLEKTAQIVRDGENDLLSMLTGNGSPHVDLVLYVILHRLKPVDIDFIRELSSLTNVLPVIAKADTLAASEVTSLKLSVLHDLRAAGIRAFLFGKSADDVARGISASPPFATSSACAPDSENMDASLLMSPDYIAPLAASELELLLEEVFSSDNAAWIRHASTKKFLNWRSKHPALSPSIIRNPTAVQQQRMMPKRMGSAPLTKSTTDGVSSPSHTSSLVHVPTMGATGGFALARIADHTQREERLAHIRLAKWAHDLQSSLRAERERYERLAKGERAIWLTEKLGECVAVGSIVPVGDAKHGNITRRQLVESSAVDGLYQRRGKRRAGGKNEEMDRSDPLGLLGMSESVRKKFIMLLQLVGAGGIASVFAVVVLKSMEHYGYMPEWVHHA